MKFGRYEIIGELGRGSMGVVFKARDPVIGRLVAVKSIPETIGIPADKREEFVKRLRQEAMTAGRLSHPNIVTIFDVGETEDGPFIAMEYLDGVTLRDVISSGKKVSMQQLIEIVAQVGEGLDYAHSKAIVHRDVKPANIMIVADNRVKLMDLGIARIPMSELTKEGKLVGSPSYMSPEQLAGKEIDGRSDLFSLGVCIYQLMTFKKPFPGETINEICYKIVHDDFEPPRRHNPDLPPDFDEFMRIALTKDPGERFQSGEEMVEALAVVAGATMSEISMGMARDDDSSPSTVVTNDRRERDRGGQSSTSNPSLTQATAIDTIFTDLTHTARSFDLSRQQTEKPVPWALYALAGAGALALAGAIVLIIARSL